MCLAREEWDDYGFRTKFYGTLFDGRPNDRGTALGVVKILHRDELVTATAIQQLFPDLGFDALPDDFASLWQDAGAYERIRENLADRAADLLSRLRDVASDPVHAESFERGAGWSSSLLRFPNAVQALRRGRELFSAAERLDGMPTSFRYQLRGRGGALTHDIDVEFDPTNRLGRLFVLVGPNGTGKTRILSGLAARLSGWDSRDEAYGQTEPANVAYSVIAISYSAFDRFKRPNRGMAAYRYSGLRDNTDGPHRVDVDGRIEELVRHLRTAAPARRRRVQEALHKLGILRDDEDDWTDCDFVGFAERMGAWSAGHQIVAMIIAHAVLWTRKRTILLFDEPELHLHPTLLSSLLRQLGTLLHEEDAFCVIATHSPIPLQEVPTRFVRILDGAGGVVRSSKLPEQTFGAELSDLVDKVFRFGPESRNFRTEVEAFLGANDGAENLRKSLDHRLSLAVRALLEVE